MSYHALGADVEPSERAVDFVPQICPDCAYLDQGTCHWCPDNAVDIPGCEGCVGHQRPETPWYARSDIVVPAMISVGTTVAATIVTALLMRQWRIR